MDSRFRPRARLLGLMLLASLLVLSALPVITLPVAAQRADRDGDGLYDDDEEGVYLTDPDNADTDGDGTSDGAEVYYETDPLVANEAAPRPDTDNDGLYDDDETDIYNTDPAKLDTDGDGVGDGEEVFVGTDPAVAEGGNPPPNPGGGNPPPNPGGGNPGGGNPGGGMLDANCLDSEEAIFLGLLNDLRQAQGAAPVKVSGTLAKSADGHSKDMGTRNFTAHTNPDGTTDQQRMVAAGYVLGNPYQVAENIFYGDQTGRGAFDWWAASPGHRANMLDPNLTVIGIGRVEVPGSAYGWYWTTNHANLFDKAPVC